MNRRFPIDSYPLMSIFIDYSGMPGHAQTSFIQKSKAFDENLDFVVDLIGKTTSKACTCAASR